MEQFVLLGYCCVFFDSRSADDVVGDSIAWLFLFFVSVRVLEHSLQCLLSCTFAANDNDDDNDDDDDDDHDDDDDDDGGGGLLCIV